LNTTPTCHEIRANSPSALYSTDAGTERRCASCRANWQPKGARLHVRANYHRPKMASTHLFPALGAMYLNNRLQRSIFLRCPFSAYRGSSLGARAAEQSLGDRHSISIELFTIRTGGRMTQLLKRFTHPAVKKPQHVSNEQTSLTSSAPLLSPISSKSSSPAINGRPHDGKISIS
jgi:hypothetical protein